MDSVLNRRLPIYYGRPDCKLVLGDCFQVLKKIKPETIDMIFADPPYFLSNDGITCQGGKMVSVNKGDWDKAGGLMEKHRFNRQWIRLCRKILFTRSEERRVGKECRL